MEDILLKLLNMSITAAYVFAFVFVLRLLLKRAPKWISYALWSLVLFRLVCPISFSSVLSVFDRVGGAGAAKDGMSFIPSVIGKVTVPPINTEISGVNESAAGGLPAAVQTAGTEPIQLLLLLGICVYVTGIAVMLIYGAVSYIRLKRQVTEATLIKGNVFETDKIVSPFVCGFLRPRIYLPVGLGETERDYVLRHERAHIRRGDHFLKLLAFAALSVHWFNPFMWLAFVLMSRDMEMSCDERVIRELEPDARAGYGETLAGLAMKRPILAGSPLAFGESGIKTRVRNVLSYKKPAFWIVCVAMIAAAAVGICLLANPEESVILAGGDIVSAKLVDGAELSKELYTELAALVDSYGRTRWQTNTSPVGSKYDRIAPEITIYFNRADNSAYTLKKYYINGFSLFRGEVDCCYILGYEENGVEVKAWRLPDSFYFSGELQDWWGRVSDAQLAITDNSVETSLEAAVIGFMEDGWWYGGELIPGEKHPGTFKASSFVTLYKEDTEAEREFYGVALYRSYSFSQNSFSVAESFQIPCVITLDRKTLACKYFWVPGDGAAFETEMFAKFPREIAEYSALHYVDYFDQQAAACDEKARTFGGLKTTELLSVTSNGETVIPYENFLSSRTYTDGSGWLNADGMSVLSDLGAVLDKLPTVTLKEDFNITYAEGVSHHGVTVVQGESLQVLYRDADIMLLTGLPEGTYYVGISVAKQGDYIEAVGDYESETNECVFRYVVNEYSYDKMLMSQPVRDKVCVMLRLTRDGGMQGYIVPKDQDAWLDAFNSAATKAVEGSSWQNSETSLGLWISYQDEYCQFADSGALIFSGQRRVEAPDAATLYALVSPVARQHGIGVFRPDMIDSLTSASLRVNKDSVTTIDADTLTKLVSLLTNVKEYRGGSACPFDALLTLQMADGTIAVLALATDSCPIYMVNGVCYEYEGSDNAALFALFHVSLPKI